MNATHTHWNYRFSACGAFTSRQNKSSLKRSYKIPTLSGRIPNTQITLRCIFKVEIKPSVLDPK